MDLVSHHSGDVNVITVNEPRIDASAAIRFKDAMRGLTASGPSRVILDLAQVRFIDSSGLGAIVASMKQLPTGHRLELAALTPDVDKVFRLTRMDTIFAIHASTEMALRRAAG